MTGKQLLTSLLKIQEESPELLERMVYVLDEDRSDLDELGDAEILEIDENLKAMFDIELGDYIVLGL